VDGRRLAALFKVALTFATGFLVLAVGPIWAWTWFDGAVPARTRARVAVWLLQCVRIAHVAAFSGAVVGCVALPWALLRPRRRGRPAPLAARGLTLSAAALIALLGAEVGAAIWLARSQRLPELPMRFPVARDPDDLHLVVIGESSAEGEPYHPWLSAGQIVAWQLERALPGRRVRVTMLATGGICLEQAILPLTNLDRPPDAILIYAGHNEFQARFGWSREVRHYLDERPVESRSQLSRWLGKISPVCELVAESIERRGIAAPPPPAVTRQLVDRPVFQPDEYAFLLHDFRRRLDGVAAYARRVGALPILVIPAGNEAGYPPGRSYLAPETSLAERAAFARDFEAARLREDADPSGAESAYRALLARHPEFAEAHFRLGRLLAASDRIDEARAHFARARDLDGMPMRCPGDFQDAYREVAARHDALLVDGPDVVKRLDPGGLLGDNVFHDGQHPTFRSYLALAQEILDQLAERKEFGWPTGVGGPVIDPEECAEHFGLDASRWAEVCRRSASFHARIAYTRHDPTEHLARADRYARAAEAIASGANPEDVGLPGLGIAPPGLRPLNPRPASTAARRPTPSRSR
jgi:tetratricopeptide (TPR) repeat protein